MIKEALLVEWDVIGWLSYVTGILSAPLVLIKPPCETFQRHIISFGKGSSSWSRSWSDRAEILLSFFPSPFCTPATLARTQSEEHVLDRKIKYVVCAIKIGLSILMTPSLCEIRQFFGQIVQSGKTLSKTLYALDCCLGYILYIVKALSGTVAVFYCEYGSID